MTNNDQIGYVKEILKNNKNNIKVKIQIINTNVKNKNMEESNLLTVDSNNLILGEKKNDNSLQNRKIYDKINNIISIVVEHYYFKRTKKEYIVSENILSKNINKNNKLHYFRTSFYDISNISPLTDETDSIMKEKDYKQPMMFNNKLYYIAEKYVYYENASSKPNICLAKDFENDDYLCKDDGNLDIRSYLSFSVKRKEVKDKKDNQIYLNDYIYDDNNHCYGYVIGFSNEEGIIMIVVKKTNKNGSFIINKYNPKEYKTLRLVDLEVKLKNKNFTKKLISNKLYVSKVENGKIELNDGKRELKPKFHINDLEFKFKTSTADKVTQFLKKNLNEKNFNKLKRVPVLAPFYRTNGFRK
jgi:hypothetical protein